MMQTCDTQKELASQLVDSSTLTTPVKITNKDKLKLLTEAFERLYQNTPIYLSKGSFIDFTNVELEAQLPPNTIHEKSRYQSKLISKIYFAQALLGIEKNIQQTQAMRRKANRQREILKKLYLALNRLIDDEPIVVKKGSRINQINVSLEAGYSASYFRSKEEFLQEILRDIDKAQREQAAQRAREKTAIRYKENATQSKEVLLRQALRRMSTSNNTYTRKGCEISITSVCIEACLEPNFLKTNAQCYPKIIKSVEAAEVERLKKIFIEAIDRLCSGQPSRIHQRNYPITAETVSIEAGFARNYLNCYKWVFTDVFDLINEKTKEKMIA